MLLSFVELERKQIFITSFCILGDFIMDKLMSTCILRKIISLNIVFWDDPFAVLLISTDWVVRSAISVSMYQCLLYVMVSYFHGLVLHVSSNGYWENEKINIWYILHKRHGKRISSLERTIQFLTMVYEITILSNYCLWYSFIDYIV